jgi:hypothetical protein
MQLKWHQKHGVPGAVPAVMKKWGSRHEDVLEDEEDIEVTAKDLEEFDSDEYDSEEEYYQ